jgi:hypothetical protein
MNPIYGLGNSDAIFRVCWYRDSHYWLESALLCFHLPRWVYKDTIIPWPWFWMCRLHYNSTLILWQPREYHGTSINQLFKAQIHPWWYDCELWHLYVTFWDSSNTNLGYVGPMYILVCILSGAWFLCFLKDICFAHVYNRLIHT